MEPGIFCGHGRCLLFKIGPFPPTFPCLLHSTTVLIRYLRANGKLHSVNLQNANLADSRTHTVLLRVSGLQGSALATELYVDCNQADSHAGLPEMLPVDPEQVEAVEVRTGQKAYLRMQVRRTCTGFASSPDLG